jgi:hypothetical protein
MCVVFRVQDLVLGCSECRVSVFFLSGSGFGDRGLGSTRVCLILQPLTLASARGSVEFGAEG